MKRLLARAVVAGSLAFAGATSAQADHAYVFGVVSVFRGSGSAVSEYSSKPSACAGTSCTVTMSLGKRDYGRFVKWCGAAAREVIASPGSFGGTVECKGPSPWYLLFTVALRHGSDALTTHSEPVTVTVNVIP